MTTQPDTSPEALRGAAAIAWQSDHQKLHDLLLALAAEIERRAGIGKEKNDG